MSWKNYFFIKDCCRFTCSVGLLGVLIAGYSSLAATGEDPSGTLVITTLEDSLELSVPASLQEETAT
jgi:hypothetical protein